MILAVLLAVTVVPSVSPADALDAVVGKLSLWQGSIDAASGMPECMTTTSSGDPEIDAVGCGALTACIPKFQARVVESADEKLDAATRRRLGDAVTRDITACVIAERDRLAMELAERRSQALNGNPNAADM